MRQLNITFYCRKCRANKDGLAAIEAAVCIAGQREFIPCGKKHNPDTFKADTARKNSEVHLFITEVERRIRNIEKNLIYKGLEPSSKDIKTIYLKGEDNASYTLSNLFNDYIGILEHRVGRTLTELSCRKFKIVADDFCKMFGSTTPADKITSIEIRKWMVHLTETQAQNTVAGKMTRLSSMFRTAFEAGRIRTFPFNNIRWRRADPEVIYLEESELELIRTHSFNDRVGKVRDLFLFQCSCGLAYVDLNDLQPEDMKYDDRHCMYYIAKKRHKTGKDFFSVVLPEGVEIWKRYNGRLPLLGNAHYNAYLKEIAGIAGIEKNLTTHIARKTYVCRLINAGVPLITVAKAVGHSDTRTSQVYYTKLNKEKLFSDFQRVMNIKQI